MIVSYYCRICFLSFESKKVKKQKETKMMKKRWNVLSLTYEIPDHEIREMKPCGTCFCKLVLDDNDTFN